MHDRSTRARRQRHRRSGTFAACAVAIFMCCAPAALADAAHGIAIQLVQPGREGLELSARLTADGGPLQQNISWTIRGPDGGTVYSGADGTADVSLAPGDYVVDASYGATLVEKRVSIPPATRLKLSLLLDAGGLKVEPMLGNIAVPPVASRVRVFSMDGRRLVAVSVTPGEIIRLPRGTYRVESRVSTGNAKAVADVHVAAGRVATVKIAHKAGLARLAFVGAPDAVVSWEIEDQSGEAIAARSGIRANVTLLPGTYTARAEVGAELLTATFNIAAGEARDILLGN
ncbi:hypothetical protein [Aestuariivirga sp.]|uniref:hypothetical protein n=1 Tax=Aestuariivirga sp. TaxID=2650926 RepID=UPI0025BEFA94|nr:hypothetical protein [Aestuariivirga sp.]MCA3555826.1 hypothetical protein [Aestuariivirga sp.]